MSFLSELKRRNVYRVAALYAVVGWLVLQVTDVLLGLLSLPEWSGKLIVVLLAAGFPVALILAWAFELTPDGVKREKATSTRAASVPAKRKPVDYVIFAAFLVVLAYVALPDVDPRPDTRGEIRSIVVLPLENLMNDPEQAYFVAGMHEALITELSKIDALKVISRTSAMSFRDSGKSVPEIAAALGVDAVVEGSVLRAGEVVRVTVQLIEAESDQHLWADNFDRELTDILALYGDVTGEIANQIRVTLTADDRAELETHTAVNPEAYELYLEGRILCDNWSPHEMAQGAELLQTAAGIEPENAAVHARLSLCLQYTAFFGYENPLKMYARARAAATMAVQLNDSLAEAHVAMAGLLYYFEFNPKAALEAINTALDLDPANVRAMLHASWLLAESGRFSEALEINLRALERDPRSTAVTYAVGQLYILKREFDAGIEWTEKAITLDRNDPSLYYYLAWPTEQLGHHARAIALHEKAISLSGGKPLYRAALGYSYGLAGMHDEAAAVLADLDDDPAAGPYDLAMAHLGVGDHDAAIDWLEKAFDARDSHLVYLNLGPQFDPLRNNERFQRLLERIDWPDPE